MLYAALLTLCESAYLAENVYPAWNARAPYKECRINNFMSISRNREIHEQMKIRISSSADTLSYHIYRTSDAISKEKTL